MLTEMLKNDFGFENCLWVFSGRRGVHCWICDPEARNMTNDMRQAVTQYFTIQGVGSENAGKITLSAPLHPTVQKAFRFLEQFFVEIVIKEQNLLAQPKHQENFLQYLSHEIREDVRHKWRKAGGDTLKMWDMWLTAHNDWKASPENVRFKVSTRFYILTY